MPAASRISGWGSCTRRLSPGLGLRSSRKPWPLCRWTRPPWKRPTRSFGPCTSARMPMGRPTASSRARIMPIRAAWSSWEPWLKLRRNTSAPPWNSRISTSGVELAGPSVAMILVRRRRRIFVRGDMRCSFGGGADAAPESFGLTDVAPTRTGSPGGQGRFMPLGHPTRVQSRVADRPGGPRGQWVDTYAGSMSVAAASRTAHKIRAHRPAPWLLLPVRAGSMAEAPHPRQPVLHPPAQDRPQSFSGNCETTHIIR